MPLVSRLSTLKNFPAYFPLQFPDTPFWAQAAYSGYKIFNFSEYKHKKNLASKICFKNTIPEDKGYATYNMKHEPQVMAAIKYAQDVANSINWEQKKSKKNYLISHVFDDLHNHQPLLKLVLHPEILGPVAGYLGIIPTLSTVRIWYSPNKENIGGSQLFHLDGADTRQVKCFIPLEEVGEDNGPLNFIPAAESEKIYKILKSKGKIQKRNQKIDDETIFSATKKDSVLQCTGKPGDISFVDTCRCYHFGSRLATKPRLLLYIHFYTGFNRSMPIWGRKIKNQEPIQGISSEIQNATLGLSHLAFEKIREVK